MAARKGAGRYIKFKYVVKLLNKENKDQSKEKHEAVLENHKGINLRKEWLWVYVHARIKTLNRMLAMIKLLHVINIRYL